MHEYSSHLHRSHAATCIIPLFKGAEKIFTCLSMIESLLQDGFPWRQIVLVNDCSPERDVTVLCRGLADRWPNLVAFISNTAHRGFFPSVNDALKLWRGETDVLLVDPASVIRPCTTRKLLVALHADRRNASAWPLGNGTVLGSPDTDGLNWMSREHAAYVDEICGRLFDGETVEVPVGVGGCMMLRSEALRTVGRFDGTLKGIAGGLDWCLRARSHGFRHVAAVDTFVWQAGSPLAGSGRVCMRGIAKLHPEFSGDLGPARRSLLLQAHKIRLFVAALPDHRPLVLHLSHRLGGGTSVYVDEVSAMLHRSGWLSFRASFAVEEEGEGGQCVVAYDAEHDVLRFRAEAFGDFLDHLRRHAGGLRVVCHSLIDVRRDWISAVQERSIPLTVVLHDYQWYCPRVVLVDRTGRFCGEPAPAVCDDCRKGGEPYDFPGSEAILARGVHRWIGTNEAILRSADKVVAPSRSAAQRYERRFPGLDVSVLSPQRASRNRLAFGTREDARAPVIAVAGALNVAKGCDWLLQLCLAIERLGARATVHLLGRLENRDDFDGLACFHDDGPYERPEFGRRLRAVDPDIVLFPGIWPETFCFVLSEVWAEGYCPVAFDVGALAERIRATGAGVLLDDSTTPRDFALNVEQICEMARALDGLAFVDGAEMPDDVYIDRLMPRHGPAAGRPHAVPTAQP